MPPPPELVCVWIADLDDPATSALRSDALLDDVERSRADAFLHAADRARFVVGVALTKRAVAAEIGAAAESVRVDRRCGSCGRPHGRPQVIGSGVHVSVSHSGALVAVAVTRVAPVGVDVQARVEAHRIPARLLLSASEATERPGDLVVTWCRKESVVKATGDGLRVAFTDVVVTAPHDDARLLTYAGRALPATVSDLDVGEAYAAALTVLTEAPITVDVRPAARLCSR